MSGPAQLPDGCVLRPARQEDAWTIRRLVIGALLDPTQLRWQQFWVIECREKVIACAQLRTFPGAQELGSLVVSKNWRNKGLGTLLSQHLRQQANQPLYLECLGERLVNFYQRLGFVPVAWQDLPQSLKRKYGISEFVAGLFRLPLQILHYPNYQ
ncbi:GNAT family N-acetyltransferase [Leptolyngbya sp. FACHB-711]|uniref:GNAT family N-acetyltransferase n=1 Tax=unclassified Leptolyngbya TaxID=2650499 RepID=UPI001684D525|nr:GNAT family N-acetyltransferase [Leptolyngbya sp. FACHB-711]